MKDTTTAMDGDRKADRHKSPERLEREIDEARERVGRTVDTLTHRLSPGELLDQALGMVKEHGGDFGRNLGTEVKRNPVPLLLTGIGLAWMMASSREDTTGAERYTANGESLSDKAKRAAGSASARGSKLKSGAQDAKEGAKEGISHASSSVHDRATSAGASLQEMLHEQPLLAGSLGMALGAAIGAMVPPSETEDELFGDTRDRTLDKAKTAAADKYDDVREKARDAKRDRESNGESRGGQLG